MPHTMGFTERKIPVFIFFSQEYVFGVVPLTKTSAASDRVS